jgi:spore maturation protein A
LNDIAAAGLDFAETAASLALGLIGVLALVLGLLKIGEEGGLIHSLTRFVQPVLRPLFPELPKDHPAMGTIALNLLANVFGLGNAATPLGIKAMEDLQKANPSDDTATNSMVMLLALNTSSVQLVPPVLLIAIMGLQVNELVFSIALATACTTVAGITGAVLLSRMKRFADTNPTENAS